jgi:hypothetical protein
VSIINGISPSLGFKYISFGQAAVLLVVRENKSQCSALLLSSSGEERNFQISGLPRRCGFQGSSKLHDHTFKQDEVFCVCPANGTYAVYFPPHNQPTVTFKHLANAIIS